MDNKLIQVITDTNVENAIKFSDKISASLVNVYRTGGLGLVFIFLGMVLIFISPFIKNELDIYTFIIGSTLIMMSFILFLILQFKNPIRNKPKFQENKKMIDELQELSLSLTKLIRELHKLSHKHISEIQTVLNLVNPIIQRLPLVSESIKNKGIKIQNISSNIVELSYAAEEIIKDIETALIQSDIRKFREYSVKVNDIIKKTTILTQEYSN